MKRVEFTIFETAIGACGIAWGETGIVGIQLPEADEAGTRNRFLLRFPNACEASPSLDARRAIKGIAALLDGEAADLTDIPLDMEGVAHFHRLVYEAARAIPPGATLSYGDVAAKIGARGAARAVGTALAKNPFAIIVPCHRILAANGKIGGFSASGGIATKRRLLEIESAAVTVQAPTFSDERGNAGIKLRVAQHRIDT